MSLNEYFEDYFLHGNRRYVPEEDLYRVNHDDFLWRDSLPEVFSFLPRHATDFKRGFQLLSKYLNPQLTGKQWRAVYQWTRAFTNEQGYDKPGDPRADWVNLRDTTLENPRQADLVCGGAILKKKFIDSEFFYPEYIDGNLPAPSINWLLKRPWLFFDALSVDGTSNGIALRRFPQGEGSRVFVLLLASKPIKIPLSNVKKLNRNEPIPSPYTYP